MPSPDAMTIDQLLKRIGTPRAPVILDVRREAIRTADPRLLPGARALPERALDALDALAATLIGQSVLVVCAEGHRLSQGTAAWLRQAGVAAEYLEGGQTAWIAANAPLIDPTPLGPDRPTTWVTRARPKIDRIACPWLIRRFIDPGARFLFVAPAEVAGVAQRFNAIPFDIEGVRFSHRDDLCSFDALLTDFGLKTSALDRLALIIRAADTARLDLAPEAPGLLAASLGLSRMHTDDHAQLEAGIALYDAFYRWARDATAEVHNWPATKIGN